MTTVTLPREVVQQAIEALEYHTEQTRPISKTEKALVAIHAALDAPATPVTQQMIDAGVAAMCQGAWESDAAEVKSILTDALGAPATVDCRGCRVFQSKIQVICDSCTDFDKFQALPPISLTKVTKCK